MKKKTLKQKRSKDFTELSEMLKAVAHPGRLAIIELFSKCGYDRLTVKAVYEQLKLEQPVASKHLGILKRNGLMKRETEGSNTYFRLNMDNVVTNCIIKCLKNYND